jgi:hypothetical protein
MITKFLLMKKLFLFLIFLVGANATYFNFGGNLLINYLS